MHIHAQGYRVQWVRLIMMKDRRHTENSSSRFYRNSEASASEFIENQEEIQQNTLRWRKI